MGILAVMRVHLIQDWRLWQGSMGPANKVGNRVIIRAPACKQNLYLIDMFAKVRCTMNFVT